jgi:hypothetical protein
MPPTGAAIGNDLTGRERVLSASCSGNRTNADAYPADSPVGADAGARIVADHWSRRRQAMAIGSARRGRRD